MDKPVLLLIHALFSPVMLVSADKVKVMQVRMEKIFTMFREDRDKRALNYNDEQIHKFEK